MNSRFLFLGLVWLAVGLLGGAGAVEPAPDAGKPSAAELVEGIVKEEGKIDDVRSLYLRFDGVTTRTPEMIARSVAERLKKGGAKTEAQIKEEFAPKQIEELEYAFDEKRARKFRHMHDKFLEVRTFDGLQGIWHTKYFTHPQEQYVLSLSPKEAFEYCFLELSWPRAGAHAFWFVHDKFPPEDRARLCGYAKDFVLTGEAEFRGRPCYILENRVAFRRLIVGVDDRRLHGLVMFALAPGVDVTPAVQRAAGRAFANETEMGLWLKSLSDEQRNQFNLKLRAEKFPLMRPQVELFLDDYREIAPGFWFATRQGTESYERDKNPPRVTARRELVLVDSKVNATLPDDLFTIKLVDGIQVYDGRYDFPFEYKQQANRTPQEWQKLVDKHRQESEAWKQENAEREKLVGQPVPEFPKSTWLNSAPLTVESLKGKVVLLDFWSTWCGPCRADLPNVERLHQELKDSGVVVIGVHAAGTEADEIQTVTKKLGLHYPMLIDSASSEKFGSLGTLANQLRIKGLPYSFLIDSKGQIVAHGSLAAVAARARNLAAIGKN